MKRTALLTCTLLYCVAVFAQQSALLPNKPGQWRYETNLPEKAYRLRNYSMTAPENLAFRKNVADLAEWFRQKVPMLKNPKGYDLRALSTYVWGDWKTKSDTEYGIPAELGFLFELFYADGGKWKVEPPQYSFDINNIAGGHHGWYYKPESYNNDGTSYDLSKESAVEKARAKLCSYFPVFPFKEQAARGVKVYEETPGGRAQIVVFNPDRPPYWLPVTLKELADASLEYFALFNKIEIDRMLFNQLKQEIAELSPEELAAPAYLGHDSHFVLKANGNEQGLQIMRFNPDYWDKKLPPSAIQFMTMWNANHTEQEMDDQAQRSYPDYPQLLVNQFNWDNIAELIMK